MASIRQRNGKWQARVSRKGHPTAEKTFLTRSDAEKWSRAVETEMDRGLYIDRTEAERSSFSEVLRRYEAEILPSKKGKEAESIRLRTLACSTLGRRTMATLSSKAIAEWRDARLKEVSGSTVNRELNIISAVINVSIREWGIALPYNPVSLVKRPPQGRGRDRRLDPAEERRLLQELTVVPRSTDGTFGGVQNPWIKPLVEFALETGMRRSELLSLKWLDIDLVCRTAYLETTKNGESRTVPLSTRAANILQGLPRSTNGHVFPLSPDAVKKAFSRACERAGISGVVFHTLRHEATSRLAEKLSNVIELAAVTGHKDLRMLQRYYHPRAADLARKIG